LKNILFSLVFISVASAAQPGIIPVKTESDNSVVLMIKQFEALADSTTPDSTGMGTLISADFTQKMVPGWNLSNTLEAIPTETSWGNPPANQRLMDSVSAAGFRSVRIPVAWSSHFSDTSTYTIDSTWMARVETVVKYVLKDSMYAIINEHWDGGWQQPLYSDFAYVNHRLAAIWKQIAEHFRNYNDHVLFAAMNEVAVTNDYGLPTAERAAVESNFCQVFVNTVRSTGGRNLYRYLLVQGYRTDINGTIGYFKMPTDVVQYRLILEDHYYDPYDFALNSTSNIIEWGMYAKDASKTETWANESWVDAQFQKLKTAYVDHGIGVVIGEYGAMARPNLSGAALSIYNTYRKYYMQYVTRSMERHRLVPMYWEGGLFDRTTGAHLTRDIINAIIDTSKVDSVTGINDLQSVPKKFILEQNYPNPFNPSTLISYQLPAGVFVTLKVYDVLGRDVETLVNKYQNAGNYSIQFNASNLPSGMYLYRLETGTFHDTKKFLLLK
jgi:endoglucanase